MVRESIQQWVVSHPKLLGTLTGILLLLAQFGAAAAQLMLAPKMLPYLGP